MQGSKELIQTESEDEIIEGLSDHIEQSLLSDERLIVWGSGGTLSAIGGNLGFQLTTLGIDASLGKTQIATDLDEAGLIEILSTHSGEKGLCYFHRWGVRVFSSAGATSNSLQQF